MNTPMEIMLNEGHTKAYEARDEDGDLLGRITFRTYDGCPSYDPPSIANEPGVDVDTGRWKEAKRTFRWARFGVPEHAVVVSIAPPKEAEKQQPDPELRVVDRELVAVPNDYGHQVYRITVDASDVANLKSVAVMVNSRRHSAPTAQVGTTLAHGWTSSRGGKIKDPSAVVVEATGQVWRGSPAILHITARGVSDGRNTRCYLEDRWNLDRVPIQGADLPMVRVNEIDVVEEPVARRSMRGNDGYAMSIRIRRAEGYSGEYRASAANGDYYTGRDEDGWVVFRLWRVASTGSSVEFAYRVVAYDDQLDAEGPTDGIFRRAVASTPA